MTRQRAETPTLTDVIKSAIEGTLADVHTMLPGEIVSFDVSTGKATVKILTKRKLESGTIVEIPPIQGVPIIFSRTEKAIIYVPITAGDKCMLLFSERSLDGWKNSGSSYDPQDKRKHHLSDVVAIPGMYSFADSPIPTVLDSTSILIENDKTRIRLKPDGKVKISNKLTQVELVKTVNDTLVTLIAEPFILNKQVLSQLQTLLLTMLDLEP